MLGEPAATLLVLRQNRDVPRLGVLGEPAATLLVLRQNRDVPRLAAPEN